MNARSKNVDTEAYALNPTARFRKGKNGEYDNDSDEDESNRQRRRRQNQDADQDENNYSDLLSSNMMKSHAMLIKTKNKDIINDSIANQKEYDNEEESEEGDDEEEDEEDEEEEEDDDDDDDE